ncbi:MerR family transcriptional regulator [Mesobacillus maritimus]|uniref:MerR family transcriptional regulator n=1 Tax=Mesobacillus maritimus TaxID=1643336 RepID=UPI002040680E|nr:MerR family transcriptional regulator [Mesobacillus maritimus]MCM3585367.1 MerR family transcriptional regulator [Mesobacillus maritimus]
MYNIKAVSKMVDMPTVTIRSWEQRYQAVVPERTESGHRVYTEAQVNDLKWLKKQVQENGIAVSQAVKMLHDKQKEAPLSFNTSELNHDQQFENQINELFQAVTKMDAKQCHFLLDLYFSQFHYKTVFFSIIVPLMYKVGDAWERGELHVAKEHMISNLVLQRAMTFFNLFRTFDTLPKVMAFCPEGEHHQLGLILFTLSLREQHYPVYYIGADTPLDGLSDLINEKDIEIVAISTSRKSDEPIISHYIETLKTENPKLKFIVGGLAVNQSKAMPPRWDISPTDQNWLQTLSPVLDKNLV